MFLGTEKPAGKTVLLLDVENGSVAAGLVRLSAGRQGLTSERPRIFGHTRKVLPVLQSLTATSLARAVTKAAHEVLHHTSTIAARMRGSEKLGPLGVASSIEIFLSSPWTAFESGWTHEKGLVAGLSEAVEEYFGDTPVSLHPFGKTLASTTHALFPHEGPLLVSTVTGEITEVLLLQNGIIAGRATAPTGHHMLLRTLGSHGGLTEAEARSALHLRPVHTEEPFSFVAAHFAREFKDAVQELFTPNRVEGLNLVRSVYVVAPEPLGEWFAKALQDESLGSLFPEGGVVRALRAHHVAPFLAAHPRPDLPLMLEALYIDFNHSSVRS